MEKKQNLCIIDADSMVYLVASKYKRIKIRSSALNDLDNFIMDVLKTTNSRDYFGFFGKVGGVKNFRYGIAKTRPYKGTRPEKEKWFIYWEKILKNHMEKVWGFIPVEHVEADDMCTIMAHKYKGSKDYDRIYIASPDKDLKQYGGTWFYDYRKRQEFFITEEQGERNLYRQSIEGDGTDNIQGLLGVGKVGALEIINAIDDVKDLKKVVSAYFNEYYMVILPQKEMKKGEKIYLEAYKKMNNLKRFTKSTKEIALRTFYAGGKSIKVDKKFSEDLFVETMALVYMLRTEEEVKVYWKDFKMPKVLTDSFVDWDKFIEDKRLEDAEIIEEDFDDFELEDEFYLDDEEEI